jgi:hypothetical protein
MNQSTSSKSSSTGFSQSPIIASKSQSPRFPTSTLLILFSLTLLAGILAYLRFRPQPTFSSFEECASHPQSLIRETYPASCITYTGQQFTAPTPTPIPITPTPTINPIPANWQTYSSPDLQLSVPSDWTISTPATASGTTKITFNQEKVSTTSGSLTLTIAQTTTNQSLESFLSQKYSLNSSSVSTQSASLDEEPAMFITNPNNFVIAAIHPQSNLIVELIHSPQFIDNPELADQILSTFRFNSTKNSNLIQSCPDNWYQSQMPQIVDQLPAPTPSSYFIYNGKRVETDQVNIDWVIANCDQKTPEIVY